MFSSASSDISQSVLRDKFTAYLKKQGRAVELGEGYCHGLVLAWAYYKLTGREQLYFNRLNKITRWDEKEDIDEEFEKLFNLIEWLHRQHELINFYQAHIKENVNFIIDESQTPLQLEYEISFNFKRDELEWALQQIIKPGKAVILASHNHTVTLIYENNTYRLYDSNHPRGIQEFKTVKEFLDHKNGLINAFIFENTRLAKKRVFQETKYIPLTIQIVDTNDHPRAQYDKPADQLLKEMIVQRRKRGENDIDVPGWNNVTALFMACRQDDFGSAKVLIDLGADVNREDKEGTSVLVLAGFGSLELVQYIMEHGQYDEASVQFQNNVEKALIASRFSYDKRVQPYLQKQVDRLRLIQAVRKNDVDALREAIELDQTKDKEGFSLLHIAAQNNSTDVLRYIIRHNLMDMDIRTPNGKTALDIAQQTGHQEVIDLLQIGLFLQAIYKGDRDAIQSILTVFPNIIKQCHDRGFNPLSAIIAGNQLDLIDFFISKGANVHFTDEAGNTVLHTAVEKNNIAALKMLEDRGSRLDVVNTKNGFSLLHHAISQGHLEVVQFLVQKGLLLNDTTQEDVSSIHLAAECNQFAILRYLLEQQPGVDINKLDNDQNTMLHYAAENGNQEMVALLCERGANVNIKNKSGKTPLHLTIQPKNSQLVEYLVTRGADVNCKDIEDETPLIDIARNFQGKEANQLMQFLLNHGADIYATDRTGMPALLWAVRNGDHSNIKFLLSKGADAYTVDHDGDTALHWAVDSGKKENIDILFNEGIHTDINKKNRDEKTPLHLAVEAGNLEIIRSLIVNNIKKINLSVTDAAGKTVIDLAGEDDKKPEILHYLLAFQYYRAVLNSDDVTMETLIRKKINTTFQDNKGNTALHIAIKQGNEDLACYVIKDSKLNINTPNYENETPLHLACRKGNIKIIDSLLAHGAHIHARADYAIQPTHLAAKAGYFEILKKLLKSGADINATTLDGMTPLHYAAEAGDLQLVKWLIKKGARATAMNIDSQSPLDLVPPEKKDTSTLLAHANMEEEERLKNKIINLLNPFNDKKLHPEVVKMLSQIRSIRLDSDFKSYQAELLRQLETLQEHLPQPQSAHRFSFSSPKDLNRAITQCQELLTSEKFEIKSRRRRQ